MGNSKIFKDLSASTIQTGITQLAGLIIFYILSRFISKEEFGTYNWSSAIGSTILAIGSLGLDLVLVKRIASGENPVVIAGMHFFHTMLVSIVVLIGLFLLQFFWADLFHYNLLFLLIITQLAVANIANSFKFSLQGLEQFKKLASISIWLNITKLTVVFLLLSLHKLSITYVILGFLIASFLELCISYHYINKSIDSRLKPAFEKKFYKEFIVQSLPQLGVVLFDSALARVDWILLGIISTVSITAEYSFTYKFFELSKLPLLILAPVLLTRFSKLYTSQTEFEDKTKASIYHFLNLELFISFIIPVIMICIWPDLIDRITDNKYGKVNHTTYIILSFCIPIHFMTNFLWTMGFVQSQLKAIMYVTIGSSLSNILLNLILIPRLGSEGAAISFLLSSILQLSLYLFIIDQVKMKIKISGLFIFGLLASGSILASKYLIENVYLQSLASIIIYISSSLLTGKLSWEHIKSKI